MKRAAGVVVIVASAVAHAQSNPAIVALERSLPRGWTVLATGTELVIRHDKAVYATDSSSAPLVTLELRYRLEPKWTDKELADAKATNARLADDIRALAVRYRIAELPVEANGRRVATAKLDDDQRRRIAAYNAEAARLTARVVRVPRCTFGDASLFDGPETYAQLSLSIDPPEAVQEARAIVELVKKQCR